MSEALLVVVQAATLLAVIVAWISVTKLLAELVRLLTVVVSRPSSPLGTPSATPRDHGLYEVLVEQGDNLVSSHWVREGTEGWHAAFNQPMMVLRSHTGELIRGKQ